MISTTLFAALGFAEAPAPDTSVTLLTEQATPYCAPGDTTRWAHPRFEVGFVRVTGSAVPLAPHVNRPVIVVGQPDTVASAVDNVPGRPGSCHIAQMRSDWVEGRDGMRVRRTKPPHFKTIAVDSIRSWDTLSAAVRADQVAVTMRSPVSRSLGLRLVVHYEGCMGKPGATSKSKTLTVTPEADTKILFPAQERSSRGTSSVRATVHSLTRVPPSI